MGDEALEVEARNHLAALVPQDSPPTVALHYRLGDYVKLKWTLTPEYFSEAMRKVQQEYGRNVSCLLFSNEPELAMNLTTEMPGCAKRIAVPRTISDTVAFHMMGLVRTVVIS